MLKDENGSQEFVFVDEYGKIAIKMGILDNEINKNNKFINNSYPIVQNNNLSSIINTSGDYLIKPGNNKIAYINNTNYYIIKPLNDFCH